MCKQIGLTVQKNRSSIGYLIAPSAYLNILRSVHFGLQLGSQLHVPCRFIKGKWFRRESVYNPWSPLLLLLLSLLYFLNPGLTLHKLVDQTRC